MKLSLLYTVFMFLKYITSNIEFDYRIQNAKDSGSNCILLLANQFFERGSIVGFASSSVRSKVKRIQSLLFFAPNSFESFVIKKFMCQSKWSLVMKTAFLSSTPSATSIKSKFVDLEKIHNYIMFTQSADEFIGLLKNLKSTQSWNPHANFILYVDIAIFTEEEKIHLLRQIFAISWKFWIANLIVFLPDIGLGQRISTWFPFDEGNCGHQDVEIVNLGMCLLNSTLSPNNINYFPVKVPLNLKQCPVRIGTVVWPPLVLPPKIIEDDESFVDFQHGIEIEMIRTIADHANFTPKFRTFKKQENWGDIYSNTNGTGMLGLLLEEKIDISIGGFTPNFKRHTVFDFSHQYMQEAITWIVPAPNVIPTWQSLFFVFDHSTWALFVVIYLIVAVVVWLLGRKRLATEEHYAYRYSRNTPLTVLAIMLGNNATPFPKTKVLRFIMIFWSFYCLHWFVAYNSSLISVLTRRSNYNQFKDAKDILESGIEFGMTEPITKYFDKHSFGLISDEYGSKILAKTQECKSAPDCLDRITRSK